MTAIVIQKPEYPKYVSHAFDAAWCHMSHIKLHRKVGLSVLYSPMGSGKTYLIKRLLRYFHNNLVIAPYRSCKEDLEAAMYESRDDDIKSMVAGEPHRIPVIEYEFKYTGDLIKDFTEHASYSTRAEKPSSKLLTVLVDDWLDSMPEETGEFVRKKLVLLDEIDFMFVQARCETVRLGNGDRVNGLPILEAILTGMSKRFFMYGLTATTLPDTSVSYHTVVFDTQTSVRINSMTTYLYRNVVAAKVLRDALQRNHDSNTGMPVLIYKRRFTYEDGKAIAEFERDNGLKKKTLMVAREENFGKKDVKDGISETYYQEHGHNIATVDGSVTTDKITIGVDGPDYIVIKGNNKTSLDSIVKETLPDGTTKRKCAFSKYRYVFINTSSSRQVSIKQLPSDRCKVMCFGTSLDATMIQTVGRFRENPIVFELHLLDQVEESARYYDGEEGLELFKSFDRFTRAYHLRAENIKSEWMGNLNQRKGKTTSDVTKQRDDAFDAWMLTRNANTPKAKQLREYIKYCKDQGVKAYGQSTFMKRIAAQGVTA